MYGTYEIIKKSNSCSSYILSIYLQLDILKYLTKYEWTTNNNFNKVINFFKLNWTNNFKSMLWKYKKKSIHVLHASGETILCYFWRIVKVQNNHRWNHRQCRQKRTIIDQRKKSKVVFRSSLYAFSMFWITIF